MFTILTVPFAMIRALLRDPRDLAVENLALRQQLAVLKRKRKRPCLRRGDRIFWVWLSRVWSKWRSALAIVQPATVVKWHRLGFRLYWTRKSKSGRTGRPSVKAEIWRLVRCMCRENPTWGAPRILSELLLLGYDVAQSTVSRYMLRPRKPPSQTWRTFLANYASEIAAIDFLTVLTATFRLLYCFVVLSHDRRKILHVNVTDQPTAQWTALQVSQAFPWDSAPRFLLRDRDAPISRPRATGDGEVIAIPQVGGLHHRYERCA